MNENKREVTIDLARYDQLMHAEKTLLFVRWIFENQPSYAAGDIVKAMLGVEEKKNETV